MDNIKEVILLRFGEIFLKGRNYSFFENTLLNNIKFRLKDIDCKIQNIWGRYLVYDFLEKDKDAIIEKLHHIFGIVSFSVAKEIDSNIEEILKVCKEIKINAESFKVETNRAEKTFPLTSCEVSIKAGEVILENNKNLKVDVHNPKEVVSIDIRQNGKTYIFYEKIKGLGGMPVGCSGKGLLLLSGGIDSPVAGYLMAKRGLSLNAIHFHSYPYTSDQAKQKVLDLANIIKEYCGNIRLFIVPFTKIQEEIHKNCDSEYMITLVRRFMMDISERVAKESGCNCIITGENLAQVASQTVEGITSTNEMAKELPVFRPLISFDKIEISTISEEIGAYKTSILPYEDCCSVFLPKNPVTHPKKEAINKNERFLDRESLIKDAIDRIEVVDIRI